jgi:alkanesulfonate monooxygenase SsuD/methylene tetrahydromethanopterin reductase-like flavin-dependent oxidoreductase (luciferase family)
VDLGIFVAPQVGATYDDQLQVARLAEDHGFRAFVRSDHYLASPGQTALPGPTAQCVKLAATIPSTSSSTIPPAPNRDRNTRSSA